MRPVHALLLIAALSPGLFAQQSPTGAWKTFDDKSGEAKSIIEIEERNGRLHGTVTELIDPEEPDPLCDRCKGDRYMEPILGMEVLWDMNPDGQEWTGGRILDPENGKTYRCKLWLENGTLRVRGYLGPFYRTQTWRRVDD